MEEEEVEDMHVCLKCNSCIMGLENYVTHRKTQCSALQGGTSPTKAKISDIVQAKPTSPPATSTATATSTSPTNDRPAVSLDVSLSPQQLHRDFQQKAQAAKPSGSTLPEPDLTEQDNQFICPGCKVVFEREQTFLVHIRGCVHIAWPSNKEDETPSDEGDGADPKEQTQTYGQDLDFQNVQPDGQFHCILCNHVAGSQEHMAVHCRSKPHSQVVHEFVEKKLGRQFEFFERNVDNMLSCEPCAWQAMYRLEMENHICQRLHQECIMNLAVPNYSIFGKGENDETPEGNRPKGIMDVDELEQLGISIMTDRTKKIREQSKEGDENVLDLMLRACEVRGNDNKFTCEICMYSTDREFDMKMHSYRQKHKKNVEMLREQLARTGTIDLCIVSKWRKLPPRGKKVKGHTKKGRGRSRKYEKIAETRPSSTVKSKMKKTVTKPVRDDNDDIVQVAIPNTDQDLSYVSCEQVNIKLEPGTVTQEIQSQSGADAKQDIEVAAMRCSSRKRKTNVKYVDDVDLSADEESVDSENELPTEDLEKLPEATCTMEENASSVTSEILLKTRRSKPGKIEYIDDVDISNDDEYVDSENRPTEDSAMQPEATYAVEESVSSVMSNIPLKRKRGRPRKIDSYELSNDEESVDSDDTLPGDSEEEPEIITFVMEESESPVTLDIPLKRKRGRPRKKETCDPPTPEGTSKGNVGRPRKSVMSNIPLKRKRGRPRKIDSYELSNDEESVDSDDTLPGDSEKQPEIITFVMEESESPVTLDIPLKRKRGRPRKTETCDPLTPEGTSKRNVGRSRKYSETPSPDITPKRNIGRPRKYPVSAEPPSLEPPHPKMASKRGRPRKTRVAAEPPSPEPPQPEMTAKRGRPRKHPVSVKPSAEPPSPESPHPEMTSKRGRPRKSLKGAEEMPESQHSKITSKQGRGRPRKYPQGAETLPDMPKPEAASKTSVGKHRKLTKPDKTQRESKFFSSVEYTCEICECDFVSAARLREHYRTKQHREFCEELSSSGTELMRCSECPAAFIKSDKYEIHLERHTLHSKAQIFHCDACHFSFLSKEALVVHKEKYCNRHKSNKLESVKEAAHCESNNGQDDDGAIQIIEQVIGEDVSTSHVTVQEQEETPMPSSGDKDKDGDVEYFPEEEEENTSDSEWNAYGEKKKKKSKGGNARDEKKMKKSKDRRIFACEMCEYYNTHMKGLLAHLETITHEAKECEVNGQEKTFQCVRCTEKFYTIRLLDVHLEKHVQAQQEFKICVFCGVMVLREEYKDHCQKLGHEELFQPKTGFKCNICDKVMRSASSLADHKYIHTGQKPHKCPMCSFCSRRKGEVTIHMKRHLGIRAFKCDQCDFTFIKRSSLRRHLVTHDKNRTRNIKCNACDATFFDTASLRIHRRNIHETDGKPRFFCEYEGCTHGSASKSDIKNHMRSHTKEKPFLCTTCGQRTATPKAMRIHQRIHTGDKPYKCTYEGCSYAARFDSHLRRHLLVHTGVKPYKCPHCDYRANIQENLRKHIKNSRKHKGMKMYKCSRCNEWEGDTMKEMINHIRKDHGIYLKRLEAVNETGIFQKDVLLGTANPETEAESAEQSGDNVMDDAGSSESNELSIMNVPLMQDDTPNALGTYGQESDEELHNVVQREGIAVEQHRVLINQAGLGAQVRTQQLVVKLEERVGDLFNSLMADGLG